MSKMKVKPQRHTVLSTAVHPEKGWGEESTLQRPETWRVQGLCIFHLGIKFLFKNCSDRLFIYIQLYFEKCSILMLRFWVCIILGFSWVFLLKGQREKYTSILLPKEKKWIYPRWTGGKYINCCNIFKILTLTLTSVASLGIRSRSERSLVRFPVRAHA